MIRTLRDVIDTYNICFKSFTHHWRLALSSIMLLEFCCWISTAAGTGEVSRFSALLLNSSFSTVISELTLISVCISDGIFFIRLDDQLNDAESSHETGASCNVGRVPRDGDSCDAVSPSAIYTGCKIFLFEVKPLWMCENK